MQVLLVSSDPSLREEFEAALENLKDFSPSIRTADSPRQGVEVARIRRPDLVCIEMDASGRELEQFATELAIHAPRTLICAAYRVDALGPGSSESSAIIAGVRAGVSDFLRRPLSSAEVGQLLHRARNRNVRQAPVDRGLVVSISSTKGGVGKSTLAVNTACLLARRAPGRVLLVDASLQLGVCARMLDLDATTTITDAAHELDRLDPTLLRELALHHDSGLHLLAAPKDPLSSTEVNDEAMARVLATARQAYEYVVVDTFPFLESVVLAILDLSDLAYLVFQGTVPCVLGHVGYLRALEGVGVDVSRQRLVLSQNHTGFSGELSVRDIVHKLGRRIDHVIPYQRRILSSMNTGEPYVLRHRGLFGFGRAVRRLVDEITHERKERGDNAGPEESPGSTPKAPEDAGPIPPSEADLGATQQQLSTRSSEITP